MVDNNMKVVGVTTQQYAFIASKERKFKINEILIIQDENAGNIKVEVVETQSFNRYIPLTSEKTNLIDTEVLEALNSLGYPVNEDEVNLAKVRTLTEMLYPIKTGSKVRLPHFIEIEKMLIKNKNGWLLGVLRGTEEVAEGMHENLKNLSVLLDQDRGIIPFNGVPFIFDFKSMSEYPHIGIFGGSGSGKSYGFRVISEEIMRHKIPTILFDPHNEMSFENISENIPTEFRKDFRNNYKVLTVGKDVGIEFTTLHPNDLANILRASTQGFTDNMDNAVRTLHKKGETVQSFRNKLDALIYVLDNPNQHRRDIKDKATLPADQKALTEYRQEIFDEYGALIANSAGLKGVQWRFNRLDRFKIFNHNIEPIIEGLKARKLLVIRGSIQHLQIFAAFALKKTYSLRRDYKDTMNLGNDSNEWFPPFIVMTDEAHNFAPKGFDSATKDIIKEIAQEGRKYGVFLALATQRPALLDDTIIAQLNTKFIFRTVRGQDIKLLADETDMTKEDTSRLPYLPSGEAFVSSAIIGRTISVKIRAAITSSPHSTNPFDEINEMGLEETNPIYECIIRNLPFDDSKLFNVVKQIEILTNQVYSVNELKLTLEDLAMQDRINYKQGAFGKKYFIREE